MRCYFTGEECDCEGDLDTECPHEIDGELEREDAFYDDNNEMLCVELQMADMSERLDRCQVRR